jgi:hypothetical protein
MFAGARAARPRDANRGTRGRAARTPVRRRICQGFHFVPFYFVMQSKRPRRIVFVQTFYFDLFCWTICSSRLMYSANVLRPAAVSVQVVSGRRF